MNKTLPYLEVSGTYEDVGRAIGTKFKKQIQDVIARRRLAIPNYERYLRQTDPYFKKTKEVFPNLIKEITALSLAAKVPLADFFFLNNREVYDLYDAAPQVGHCTIAVSFNNQGAIVGHNEDWDASAQNDLYILKATIGKTTFLGLQYLEALGVSATMNNWGLCQCINDLSEKVQPGIPKNFIARAILECRSLDEAENIIRANKCASAFNHVLVQNHEVRNIEISGDKIGIQKVVDQPYVHTNHYLTPEMAGEKVYSAPSSIPRYDRAKQIVKNNMSVKEMTQLLSDKTNSEFPICRTEETIGSAIFTPETGEAYFCYGHPCEGTFTKYHI